MFSMFSGLWRYRQFISSSIRNELVSRFARSKLGGLWMILNPLLQVAIYALILSNVLQSKLPGIGGKYKYAIYLMAGLLGWSLFSEIISRSANLFISNGNLMKKMYFPRITLPTILTASCLLNNILFLVAVLFVFVLMGQHINMGILWLIPLTFIVALLALGIGLIISILNVFLRDIGEVIPMALQVWFWFTPIVYPQSVVPEQYRQLLNLNPMYPLIEAYHQILVYGEAPQLLNIIPVLILALLLIIFSLFLFRQASPEMVDVL